MNWFFDMHNKSAIVISYSRWSMIVVLNQYLNELMLVWKLSPWLDLVRHENYILGHLLKMNLFNDDCCQLLLPFLLQLLLCLRILIRRCVYANISKDEIQKLFPEEVLPELKRLLTLLLQKFQREWREDIQNEQVRV